MKLKARDIMVQDYATIYPDEPVTKAARLIFEGRIRETGYKPFGIMVISRIGRLLGMISMSDILYNVRPPFMNYQREGIPLWEGELDFHLERFNAFRVDQIMSSPVFTVSPDDSIIVVIDKMVKKRVRRLPVEDGEKLFGIVYMSDVYYHFYKAWLRPGER